MLEHPGRCGVEHLLLRSGLVIGALRNRKVPGLILDYGASQGLLPGVWLWSETPSRESLAL